jgi:hypothetical protein
MTAKRAAPKPTTPPADLHLPTWSTCPECGHRSTGRIQHGPHPKGKG